MQLCPFGRHFTHPLFCLSLCPTETPGDPWSSPSSRGFRKHVKPFHFSGTPLHFHDSRGNSHKGHFLHQMPRRLRPRPCSTWVTKQAFGTSRRWTQKSNKLHPPVSPGAPQWVTSFNPAISDENYREAGTQVMTGAGNGLMRMNHVTSQPSIDSAPHYQHQGGGGSFNM